MSAIHAVLDTPIGTATIVREAGGHRIMLHPLGVDVPAPPGREAPDELAAEVAALRAYFEGRSGDVDIPLPAGGTDFRRRVWEAVRRIPPGRTMSYAAVAGVVGSPRGARAVGLAMHDNPLPIAMPCHRVVSSSGGLTGYRYGLGVKAALLAFESRPAEVSGGRFWAAWAASGGGSRGGAAGSLFG